MLFVSEDVCVKQRFGSDVLRVRLFPAAGTPGISCGLHLLYCPENHEVEFGAESGGAVARGQQQGAGSCYSRTVGPVFLSR